MGTFNPEQPKNYPNPPYDRPNAEVLTNHWAALAGGLGGRNWVGNDDFRLWPAGDAAAPAYWNLSGAGATPARCGTGLADTTRKVGDYCAKVTAGGAGAVLYQYLVPTGSSWTRLAALLNPSSDFSFGCWCWSASPNTLQPYLQDGASPGYASHKMSQAGALSTCDGYHPGDSAWWFLMGKRSITAGSKVVFQMTLVAGATGYLGSACVLYGTAFPFNHQPCDLEPIRCLFPLQGGLDLVTTPYTTVGGVRVYADKPWIVRETHLATIVGPTGQALIVDVNKSGTSMYSTLPQIDDGDTVIDSGEGAPDGTYANRCLARGDYLSVDLDQKGSTVDGEDLAIQVRGEAYVRPQDRFLAPAEVGA